MKQYASFLLQIIVALSLPALCGMDVAFAQGKAASPKVEAPKKGEPVVTQLIDNESITAVEVTLKPGDISTIRARPARMVYYVSAAQFLVTFPDGKTEVRKFKAGETVWRNAETIEVKNTGKSSIRLLQVTPKSK